MVFGLCRWLVQAALEGQQTHGGGHRNLFPGGRTIPRGWNFRTTAVRAPTNKQCSKAILEGNDTAHRLAVCLSALCTRPHRSFSVVSQGQGMAAREHGEPYPTA